MRCSVWRGAHLRGEHRGGIHLFLAHAALPAALDERHREGAQRRTAVGDDRADEHEEPQPDQDEGAPSGHGGTGAPHPDHQGGHADPARPDAGREQQRSADPGQLQERAVGLAQEDAAEREATEGPRHADGLGQGAGRHERRRPAPPGRGEHGCGGEEQGLERDQHDGAVPIEGPGPDQPGEVAAQPGEPARPHPGPGAQPGQPPVEQPRPGQAQWPPSPRREREGEQYTGAERREGDTAPARREVHETARAAALPLAMQAGMPTPR